MRLLILALLLMPSVAFAKVDVSIGGTITDGNSHSETYNAGFESSVKHSWTETKISSSYTYQETDNIVSKDRFKAGIKENFNPDKKWVPFIFGRYETDRAEDLEYDNQIGVGAKYNFIRTKRSKVSLSGAFLYQSVKYKGIDNKDNIRLSLRPKMTIRIYNFNLMAYVYYQPSVYNSSDYIIDGKVELQLQITNSTSAVWSYENKYITVPESHSSSISMFNIKFMF